MKLRRLTDADAAEITAIFTVTLALGSPLDFELDGAELFSELCIGWYLDHGRQDSVVAVDDDGSIVGYGLVCTKPVEHRKWLRRTTITTTARLVALSARGAVGARSRQFYADRFRDAARLARSGWHGPALGHAHLNLREGARTGRHARAIRDHIDARCRVAGLDGWVGEINARGDRRAAGLARVAGEVVSTTRNHTMSRLAGEPVRRLTIVRRLPIASVTPIHRAGSRLARRRQSGSSGRARLGFTRRASSGIFG